MMSSHSIPRSSAALPSINALWIGGSLGAISRCCLKSFLQHGHEVNLYAYDDIPDVPAGITLKDASIIIPHSEIFKHRQKNSYAPFSDIFSYELLTHLEYGIYVDCDVYCIKPITLPEHGYLMGYESDTLINVAVLALPKESALLKALLQIRHNPNFMPEWYPPLRQLRLKIKRLFGFANDLATMPWGITGPSALTYYINKHQLQSLVQPMDVLYPIQYATVNQLLDPNLTLSDIISERSVCVHLYNEVIKGLDLDQLPATCILAQMLDNRI